ncbi:hypothetical protein ACQ4PT_003453 [Festuca glaucescens]
MGKKRVDASSSAAASATAVPTSSTATDAATAKALQCDWMRSTMMKREENKMRRLGLISTNENDIIFPAHEFLRCLLFSYGIQLWQLTPNSILHLAIFITICESFLGIDPHWGLWKKIFFVKRHCGNNSPYVVGGVSFVVRKEAKYFHFPVRESVQGWRQKWFYLRDQQASSHRSDLPKFSDVLEAKPKKSWRNILTGPVADELYERVLELKNSGGQTMLGTEFAALFLKRRIQLVMSRGHPMWLKPVFAMASMVADFAAQFVKIEAENAQLREELAAAKSSAEQIETANKLAAEAWQKAEDLEKELTQVKAKLEKEQKLKEEAQSLAEKREDRLRKSVESLLGAADTPVDRSNKLRVDSMTDAISFAVDSGQQVQGLLKKTKAALSKLYALVFQKLSQEKSLGELAEAFFVDNDGPIEVPPVSWHAVGSSSQPVGNESELVQLLRSRISRMEKDLMTIHTGVAIAKKKGELATKVEQYAQDELMKATESLHFICLNESEENKRVHNRVNALTNLSQPHGMFWTDRSKAAVVVKFQDRVEQVHAFFERCRTSLAMVWGTLFPLNLMPSTLLALINKFKTAAEVRTLVRNQLTAGAEITFSFVQARYSTLDLMLIANGPPLGDNGEPVDLEHYYPFVRRPAMIVINKLEKSTKVALQARAEQGARGSD